MFFQEDYNAPPEEESPPAGGARLFFWLLGGEAAGLLKLNLLFLLACLPVVTIPPAYHALHRLTAAGPGTGRALLAPVLGDRPEGVEDRLGGFSADRPAPGGGRVRDAVLPPVRREEPGLLSALHPVRHHLSVGAAGLLLPLGSSGGWAAAGPGDGPAGRKAGIGEAPAGGAGGGGMVFAPDGGGAVVPAERDLSAAHGVLRALPAVAVFNPDRAGAVRGRGKYRSIAAGPAVPPVKKPSSHFPKFVL